MSLESQIQTLTDAINNLAFIMQQQAVLAPATPVVVPVAAPVVKIIPEPEPRPIPIVEAFPPTTLSASPSPVVMPPLPMFTAPAKTAPFKDAKGLMDYVMASYTSLGAEKGAQIQDIMVGLGYQHINDIKAEHYGALFEKVEALK